jgi:hypothetical protein
VPKPKPNPNRTVAEAVGYHSETTSARPGCDCEFCEIFRLREALEWFATLPDGCIDTASLRPRAIQALNR